METRITKARCFINVRPTFDGTVGAVVNGIFSISLDSGSTFSSCETIGEPLLCKISGTMLALGNAQTGERNGDHHYYTQKPLYLRFRLPLLSVMAPHEF